MVVEGGDPTVTCGRKVPGSSLVKGYIYIKFKSRAEVGSTTGGSGETANSSLIKVIRHRSTHFYLQGWTSTLVSK